jgi:CYTH domain-containing protein
MEIERKYLVRELPADLDSHPHVEIEQGYLCTSPTLRIRRMGDAYILTVKEKQRNASSAIVNREEEFALTADKYNLLKAKCDGFLVSKTRYRIPVGEYTAELDIFHGNHDGLLLVEVEFPSAETADRFTPPSWFGPDVSADPRYRNSYLAHNNS